MTYLELLASFAALLLSLDLIFSAFFFDTERVDLFDLLDVSVALPSSESYEDATDPVEEDELFFFFLTTMIFLLVLTI